MKVTQGHEVKHWLDEAKDRKMPWSGDRKKGRTIALPGNYIRISADAMAKMQEIRNKGSKKKLSLIEQQRQWEQEHIEEE